MCTFYNNQNSIHTTEPLLQHRLPAPVVLVVPALLEQKRVVQVMSRRAGNGAKRRVPRVALRRGDLANQTATIGDWLRANRGVHSPACRQPAAPARLHLRRVRASG